jgi:hypothetical protein
MSAEQDEWTPPDLWAALALTVMLASATAALPLLPRLGEPVAVFSFTGTQASLIAAVRDAGGAIAGLRGRAIVLAMPGDAGFVSRLRSLGYWLVLDARAADLCANPPIAPGEPLVRQSR